MTTNSLTPPTPPTHPSTTQTTNDPNLNQHDAEARSVVVTQPNNKLSRVLKALLKELPAQLTPINAAGLEASAAMAEGGGAGMGGEGAGAAAEYARGKLQERLRLLRGLQVRPGGGCWLRVAVCERAFVRSFPSTSPSTKPNLKPNHSRTPNPERNQPQPRHEPLSTQTIITNHETRWPTTSASPARCAAAPSTATCWRCPSATAGPPR